MKWDEPGQETTDSILMNSTNNPLERYNRTFGEVLGTHRNMVVFINGIFITMEDDYLDMMRRIRHKLSKIQKSMIPK